MLQPLWGALTPRLPEDALQGALVDIREMNPEPEVASPTASVGERPRLGFDQHLTLISADADQQRDTVLSKARQELASNLKHRTPGGDALLNARE
ncbi:hypothetical protein OFEAOIEE_LOCUS5007 [Methylorubrum extorquens]